MEKFKIKIKEIATQVIEVEADSYDEARAQVEAEYWKNPNDYLLEPEDTIFE